MLSLYTSLQLLIIGFIWLIFAYLLFGSTLIRGIIAVHDKRLKDVYNLLRSGKANDTKKDKASNKEPEDTNTGGNVIGNVIGKLLSNEQVQNKIVEMVVAPPKKK